MNSVKKGDPDFDHRVFFCDRLIWTGTGRPHGTTDDFKTSRCGIFVPNCA
jgi:hypothetical protein